MRIRTTNRGFAIATFRDGNGDKCSIQESSAMGPYIWLGVDDPDPRVFPGNGTGWHPYPLPKNVVCTTRMHLTQANVKQLLPLLERFIETGTIALPARRGKTTKKVRA